MAKAIEFNGVNGHPDFPPERGYSSPLPSIQFATSSTSCWQLTPEELAEVNRTGVIWVTTSTIGSETKIPADDRIQPAMRVTAFEGIARIGFAV